VSKKKYESSYGPVEVFRHTYQSSQGGKQYVPLEEKVGFIGLNTPRFAKMLSWKYGHLPSERVEEDLLENHCRSVSRSHIQSVSYLVGEILLEAEEEMEYVHGISKELVKSVSVGRDGAMLPLIDGTYREAMVGTLSLVGADREVLHTIYLGDKPEYGKASFNFMMDWEIGKLKAEFGDVPWIGLADGAAHNWTFLASHVETKIIDWYHTWNYISKGIAVLYPKEIEAKQQSEIWEKRLQEEENSVIILLKEFKKHQQNLEKNQKTNEILQKTITYLSNHHLQMNYAQYLKKGYLIGSGVTESACKTLIKNRFCGCGMQWQEDNAQLLTLIRGLILTPKRWKQAWKNLSKSAA
jgi:hypothetical protein